MSLYVFHHMLHVTYIWSLAYTIILQTHAKKNKNSKGHKVLFHFSESFQGFWLCTLQQDTNLTRPPPV